MPWRDVLGTRESIDGTRCYIVEFETDQEAKPDLLTVAQKSLADLRKMLD